MLAKVSNSIDYLSILSRVQQVSSSNVHASRTFLHIFVIDQHALEFVLKLNVSVKPVVNFAFDDIV